MSEEISLDEIKKFWPDNAPDVNNVPKYVKKYKKDLIVIKYGGNVLIDRNIFNNFIQDISILNRLGLSIVVVHGGGPRIERELKKGNIESKFINGLRVTGKNVINIVERVLIDFNNDIVTSLNKKGSKAVSIHTQKNNVINVIPDKPELGFVGVPQEINIELIKNIISQKQIPIVAPLGLDKNQQTYNILTGNYTVRQILNIIKKEKFNVKLKKTRSPILNQNSYKVSRDKFDKFNLKFSKNLKNDIKNTLDLLKGIY